MEIRHERIDRLEAIAGVDKDPRFPLACVDDTAFIRNAFEHAAGGGPDGDDPPACGTACVDLARNRFGDAEMLSVHQMVLDPIGFHGTEGAKPDMKQDLCISDTACTDLIEQLTREMKSRCGCGSRALDLGVDGLIALGCGATGSDVGGKRKLSDRIENRVDPRKALAIVGKGDPSVSSEGNLDDLPRKDAVAKGEAVAHLRTLSGTNERFPLTVVILAEKQKLDLSAVFLGFPEKSCGNDL